MLEPNVNANQPFNNNLKAQNKSSLIAIEQFNQQINFLRARLASELSIHSLLVERAQHVRKNQLTYSLPSFNFFTNQQAAKDQNYIPVKKQENPSLLYGGHCTVYKQLKKSFSQLDQKVQEKVIKPNVELNSQLKIEEKSEIQPEQNNEKNETKNIPKNYGKAMLSFIQKNIQRYVDVLKPILQKEKLTIVDLLNHIKKHKKEVNSIHYLKLMWGFQNINDPIFKCIRILSHIFMRKHCLYYIFNSRIKNYNTHIKYRKRILQGIENPAQFSCIKQF